MQFENNIPIYIQLVEAMKLQIIAGRLKPGDRIPSVRELALMHKVNPNTMQKALSELEELELIYTERTNGKFVTADETLIAKFKKDYADALAEKFLASMAAIGFNREAAATYIREER
ncbi:MAG: GntR family transcriptional regulator [Clostridia bacterium]|nr:GntR family transcriptional regulator [Clostridia bacterium]